MSTRNTTITGEFLERREQIDEIPLQVVEIEKDDFQIYTGSNPKLNEYSGKKKKKNGDNELNVKKNPTLNNLETF